jgi:hypothetical protein
MKKSIAVLAVAALFPLAAFAGGNNNNSDTINNFGDTNTYNQPTAVGLGIGVGHAESNATGIGFGGSAEVDVRNTNTAIGGAGGQGGDGGNAAVIGSGNSHNDIDNKVTSTNVNANTNSNRNDVSSVNVNGQQQGQVQGQSQSSKNDNRSSASNTGYNTNDINIQGDTTVYKAARIPVSSSYAPANFPTATCMGSTSGGAQGVGFGISFGTSWKDENCMLLEQVRATASVLGDKDTAAMMMCGVKAYKAVRQEFCDSLNKPKVAAQVETTPLAVSEEPQAAAKPAAYVGKPAEGNAAQLY